MINAEHIHATHPQGLVMGSRNLCCLVFIPSSIHMNTCIYITQYALDSKVVLRKKNKKNIADVLSYTLSMKLGAIRNIPYTGQAFPA